MIRAPHSLLTQLRAGSGFGARPQLLSGTARSLPGLVAPLGAEAATAPAATARKREHGPLDRAHR
ncbi:MAG: hypothetical protein M3P41_08350 [Actinomycetota bacterium]|nr:hypothetical protein [Actinomycetota bacterium]